MFEEARIKLYAASLILSGMAGLASQFRLQTLTLRGCAGAFLNAALCGLSITMIGMSTHAATYPEALLGLSMIAGLGGMKTIEVIQTVGQDIIASFLRSAADRFTKNPPPPPGGGP